MTNREYILFTIVWVVALLVGGVIGYQIAALF